MIDKGKYSCHGTMIKKLPSFGLAKMQKSRLAVINPLPNTIPRQQINQFKLKRNDLQLTSKTFNPIFKFQQKIKQKPVEEDLIQPFMYIQTVLKKSKVDSKQWNNLKPFVASSTQNRPASAHVQKKNQNVSQIPPGYLNLFQYQQEKRKVANKIFKKLLNAGITNVKDVFLMQNKKKINIKENLYINVKENQFVDFLKELLHQNITEKQIKHFFQLYKNKHSDAAEKQALKGKTAQQKKKVNLKLIVGVGMISIKSFSLNYDKFLKNQVQISNISSQKALRQRYTWVKRYLTVFDQNYQELKRGMNNIREYEQSLRQHFKSMYNSYSNPFEHQINQLKSQLQKPIIKYDKFKKDTITLKIKQLEQRNNNNYHHITEEYEIFSSNYQNTIVRNHDLFFNKRIICKLVLPILNRTTFLNKQLLNRQIQVQQEKKRLYLECLSNIVVEIDKDKKMLGEDCFTLADIVQMVLMKFNKNKNKSNLKNSKKLTPNNFSQGIQSQENQYSENQFVLKSMKKLIKQIKKQYLLKNQLFVENIDQFPADQQIPLEILHTCFEMQCTKVLAKNHIWTQLLNLIPQATTQSKFHQQTITCNQCLGYLKKYFLKLDQNFQIQRRKSKQVSLLIENATLDSLWYYNSIVDKVNRKIDNYDQDLDEQQVQDKVNQLEKPKKVNFFDISESYIEKQNNKILTNQASKNQRNQNQYYHEQNIVAKDILRAIFNIDVSKQQKMAPQQLGQSAFKFIKQTSTHKAQDIPQSLEALKTLSKSFIVPQKDRKYTTNSFDIRFYEKNRETQQQQQDVYRLGTSNLLSYLPQPEQLNLPDNPLKISQFLQKNITGNNLEFQRTLHNKLYDSNVKEGVDKNYYKDKIKLENRPTRYDSQGKSKYSVLFPVGYYEGIMINQQEKQDEKWYLRSHHVQTLTENPLSKKDNIINTQYQSKLDKIPLKKRPQQFVIQQNVQRKSQLIQSLQERIDSLKSNLENVQRNKKSDGQKVPNAVLNKYLSGITQGKQDKQLEMAAYEAVLYDLRRNQRNLVVDYRDKQNDFQGQPQQKWWQKKDRGFNIQLKKQRLLSADTLKQGSPHKQYVQKLKNRQIY